MTQDYTTEAEAVADAMNAVYENKQTNKKNDISGDFSSDNASYPTVKAAKAQFGTKVTTLSGTPSDTNYPSEKLMKTELDKKADISGLADVATSGNYNDLDNIPSTFTPASHTHGDITDDGKLGTTANKPLITTTGGKIAVGNFGSSANTFCEGNDSRLSDARTPTAHEQATSTIKEASALSNIGTSANASQHDINDALNTKIGALQSINAIQIVTSLGTASASTLGKLYIISEDSNINVYYTEQNGSNYSWHKMDADILDELSISWNDITGKPSSFTPSSHAHGNLTNDGKVGTASGKPLITGTGGAVTAGSFGTSSGTFAEGNHTHNYASTNDIQSEITAFSNALAAAINPSS